MTAHPALSVFLLFFLLGAPLFADDWPQWRGPDRDGVWHEDGIVEKFDSDRLEPVWTAPVSSGYSGPTVADGRVYVTDRLNDSERVHCFDEQSGQGLWTHTYKRPYDQRVSYPSGPRAAVTIDQGRAFALGTLGDLHCLDAASGDVLWYRDLDQAYQIDMPNWCLAAAPLIHSDLVILHIGGENNACLVALDKATGQERWRSLNDRVSYSAPILIEQAGQTILVCWTGDSISALDPKTGKAHWRIPFKPNRMVINTATPVVEGPYLFVSSFYDGSELLRLAPNSLKAQSIWKRVGVSVTNTDALQCMISTPLIQGDAIYGVDAYGHFRCLDLETGDRIWESLEPVPEARWATVHMVENGDRVWMFNEKGELIISRLSREGFHEIDRTKIIEPTDKGVRQRNVCWAHPAFANRHVFARSDEELIRVSLEAN